MDSVIRLFKAVPVVSKKPKKTSKSILKETIKRGFVFSPEVVGNYSEEELTNLIAKVENEVGLSAEKMNNTFHKSWEKVATEDINVLVAEQVVHYITTYGFEYFGIYDESTVYIPVEKLKIPKIKEGKIKLTIIKGYTKEELKTKIVDFLSTGIALNEQSVLDSIDICKYVKVLADDIENIKNKEVKIALYDYFSFVPKNPTEFLRYVVYKVTGKTLLIKSKRFIEQIKESDLDKVVDYFSIYETRYGLNKLSQIFLRFKPIFLALKNGKNMSNTINKLRRLAKTNHKPMPEDFLNEITNKIKNNAPIDVQKLSNELKKVNTFRKIRLAYALNYRLNHANSIVYKVRNGSSYATEFSFDNDLVAKNILSIVKDSIIEDLKKNVEGKTILVPNDVVYALPATEKQFTGDFPSGSYVAVPKDMVLGVHWMNVGRERIDLDLSMSNANVKVGWDGAYRSYGRSGNGYGDPAILFSGDITDAPAPNGASELFYVKKQEKCDYYILNLNYYNYSCYCSDSNVVVPFKIVVGVNSKKKFGRHYTLDPNDVVCVAKSKMDKQQKMLGLLEVMKNECRFYFCESNNGTGRTARFNETAKHTLAYLVNSTTNPISLNDMLVAAGANVVTGLEDGHEADINLLTEEIEKDAIIKLLS